MKKRIIRIEIIDQTTKTNSNFGKALVGGALFGAVGAIAGAASKNTKSFITFLEWYDDGTQRTVKMEEGTATCNIERNLMLYLNKYWQPVECVETGEQFNTMRDAISVYGEKVFDACEKPKKKTAGGYHWRYVMR